MLRPDAVLQANVPFEQKIVWPEGSKRRTGTSRFLSGIGQKDRIVMWVISHSVQESNETTLEKKFIRLFIRSGSEKIFPGVKKK